MHVVEVHADLAGQVGRPVRVRVAEAAVLLVAPRPPRVTRTGERSIRAGQARPLGIGAFRSGRGERLPAAAAFPGRGLGCGRRRAHAGIDELLRAGIIAGTGVALDLVAAVGGVHHLVELIDRVARPELRDADLGADRALSDRVAMLGRVVPDDPDTRARTVEVAVAVVREPVRLAAHVNRDRSVAVVDCARLDRAQDRITRVREGT